MKQVPMRRHPWVKGIQVRSNEGSCMPLSKWIYCNSEIKMTTFKNRFQSYRNTFSQTWHKAPFGKGDSSLFKRRAMPSFKLKNTLTSLRNISQNYLVNSNQTWHKSSLVEGDSSLSKWRTTIFSKEKIIAKYIYNR